MRGALLGSAELGVIAAMGMQKGRRRAAAADRAGTRPSTAWKLERMAIIASFAGDRLV